MRNIQLDLLRALAIFLVVGHHMSDAPITDISWFQKPLDIWRTVGWIGVDLFFVLSGFLVSGLLFKELRETGSFKMGRFLIRRGFKIYPSYYVFLVLSLPVVLWTGLVTPYSFGCEAFFVSNYLTGIWGHTWTLCVEEHFYLLLALGFFIVCKHKRWESLFLPGCLLFLVAPLCLRFLALTAIPYHEKPHYSATLFRIDALAFGVLLSFVYQRHKDFLVRISRRYVWLIVPVALALIAPCALGGHAQYWLYTLGLTLLYLGWGLLLIVFLSYDLESGSRLVRWLARLGVYSYSIYLWHKPFAVVCALPDDCWPIHTSNAVRLIIYISGTILMGIFMSNLVEGPFLRMRDRLFPGRSGGSEVPATVHSSV